MSEEAQLGELSNEVFETFLAELKNLKIPEEVQTRLRKTLLVNAAFTDTALRAAVFGEESSQ